MSVDDVVASERARVSALRLQLLDLHPFWGYLLAHLRVLPAPGLPAFAATDCVRRIWFNPLRTQHLSMAQLGFVLVHELGHHLLASADRRRGRHPHRWNCATDFAINRIVAAIEHPARPGRPHYASPDGTYPELGAVRILLDPRWDGMIAEAIYEELGDDALPRPGSVEATLSGEGGGLRLPNVTDHGGGIDLHLPDRLGEGDRREIAQRIRAAVQHAEDRGRIGDVPGAAELRLDGSAAPRVPWRRLLRRYAGSAVGRDDLARHRPDRRFLELDVAVPGRWSEGLGRLVVALDTSASMPPALLASIGAELRALARQAEEVLLVVADAEVQQVVTELDLERFLAHGRLRGGGGTDHRPVFALLRERGVVPDLFVGITDLCSRFPDRPPGFPVLWLAPEDRAAAPWGRVVEVFG